MNQKSFLQWIIFSLLAFGVLAFANGEKTTGQLIAVDPAKGEALFTNGDTTRNIIACISCHGAAGNSTIAQNPKLAGQHADYLIKQFASFSGPTRNNAVMTMIAKALTPEDINNLSAYLSKQVAKPGAAKNKDLLEKGKQIYRAGIATIAVPACAGCHGPTGAGIPGMFPRLAGQHQDYTIAQLTNFHSGVRSNSIEMRAITHRMSEEEIKAVADYIAGLK